MVDSPWYTAAELADLSLPGLPATTQGITARAKRETWHRRERKGSGGGWEYHLDELPPQARVAIVSKSAASREPANDESATADLEAAHLWAEFERLPTKLKEKAQVRLRAMRALKALVDCQVPLIEAYEAVAAESGQSVGTVRRHWSLVKNAASDAWLPILVPQYKGRQPKEDYDPRAWEVFKADYLRPSKPAAKACYRRLERIAKNEGWAVPTLGVLMRRLQREVPLPLQTLGREGARALHELYPAQERDRSGFHAMQGVNGDGHKIDLFAQWPDGTVSRPILVGWQDLYSGKLLAWRLAPSEDANTVRLSFGDLIERWGIPEHAWCDNGRAFAAKQITGGAKNRYRFKIKADDPDGLFVELGIAVHWTRPHSGQSKPIERYFGEVAEYVAKHPAFEGAYCGNRPDAKPANYGSRAIPIDQIERVCNSEIAALNARSGRRSKVCAGRSLDEAFQESYASSPIRRASGPQRRLFLLQAEGLRTDRRNGAVKIAGNRYWSETLAAIPGARVVVRFDPERLHQPVHVYGLDGRYLCQADVLEAAGFADMDAAQGHARARNDFKRAQRKLLDAERRMTAAEVAKLLPDHEPGEEPEPNVVRPLFDRKPAGQEFDQAETDQIFNRALRKLGGE